MRKIGLSFHLKLIGVPSREMYNVPGNMQKEYQ